MVGLKPREFIRGGLARFRGGARSDPQADTPDPVETPAYAPDIGGRRIVGFGHSHLSAYLRAWNARQRDEATLGDAMTFVRLIHKNFQPNFETVAGVREVAPDLKRRIRHIMRRDTPEAVVCVLMGNEYNSIAMVRHPEPFDFDYPARPGHPAETADPGAVRLPFAAIRAELTELANQNALLLWREISSAAECPVYLIPPPPPIPDENHIRTNPGKFGVLVKRHGLNPPEMRRRMWRLYCEVLREGVADSNTHFIELADEVFEDGYLAPQFWQGDPTHANAAYGEIMLARLRQVAFGDATEVTS